MNRGYKNGKICCVKKHLDDDIHVGSTTQALSKRMAEQHEHEFSPKNMNLKFHQQMNEFRLEHAYIRRGF